MLSSGYWLKNKPMSRTRQGKRTGRFDDPSERGADLARILAGMWDGIRLRCPSCGEGKIFARGFETNERCSECGAPFDRPGEGDFLMAMIFAYSLAGIVVLALIYVLNRITDMDVTLQLALTLPVGVAIVLLSFRSVKGIWITLLIAVLKWDR